MKHSVIIAILPLLITSCASNDIKDSVVGDRVKACSAGFSRETQGKLEASLNKTPLSGSITGDIKSETKALIFAETPVEDHVKVYEDYIKCVEDNWNVVKVGK